MEICKEDTEADTEIFKIFSQLSLNTSKIESPLLRYSINQVFSGISSEEQLGITSIRKILSSSSKPPIQEIIDTKILPILIKMSYKKAIEFRFEVCWILCNIASGSSDQTTYLIELGILDFFYDVFDIDSNSLSQREQIVWAIGNIAGDCIEARNLVNNSKVLQKVLDFTWEVLRLKQFKAIENCIWALSNCVRKKPNAIHKIFDLVYGCFLEAFILCNDEADILSDILWSLTYITEYSSNTNGFENTHLKKLVSLLESPYNNIIIASLKIIGNLSERFSESCKILIPLNCIQKLFELINSEKSVIRRETYWILSNMCAESNDTVSIILDIGGYLQMLNNFDNEDINIAGEIIWVISNSVYSANEYNTKIIFENGWCQKFFDLIKIQKDEKYKEPLVEGLKIFLLKCPDVLSSEMKKKILNLEN